MFNNGRFLPGKMKLLGLIVVPLVFLISCSGEEEFQNNPIEVSLSIEEKESYEDDNIYLVAFEIESNRQIFRFDERDKQTLLDLSTLRYERDKTNRDSIEIHYYFYAPGSKIPPFSKIKDYNRVENLLWVDIKSFDSPFMEWTNSLMAEGELYEWKIE
jgi:hypothetical protein